MQLGPSSRAQIPDGLLAAMTLLSEKPHQGVPSSTHTMYQGFGFVIANPALGMPPMLYDEGLGSRCTGKERDTESGNDYMFARYYNSATGRFLSPDWDAKSDDPVPYAKLDDPQSLNLYSYVLNNPVGRADADGHCVEDFCIVEVGAAIALFHFTASPVGQKIIHDGVSATVSVIERAGSSIAGLLHPDGSGQVPPPPPPSVPVSSPQGTPPSSPTEKRGGTGPKAANAPGVSAGGQATDEYGRKRGPSGKPQINETDSNTREGAGNRSLDEGSGKVEHANPARGKPHFHPTDAQGNKKPGSTHHNYPDN